MTLLSLRTHIAIYAFYIAFTGTVYLNAQDQAAEEEVAPDTVSAEAPSEVSVEIPAAASVAGSDGLETGYKGYAWGSMISSMPTLAYMDSGKVSADTVSVTMSGKLGLEEVVMAFFYGRGGFWKVEIDYSLDHQNIDEQVKLFTKIEKTLTEVYGPPKATNQLLNGPNASYSDAMNIKYSRAFYRSSWNVTPTKVELILSGFVQTPPTDFPIIHGQSSFMKLVYYNPDFMLVDEVDSDPEPLPSIFDIY